jgi:hypothetical protein
MPPQPRPSPPLVRSKPTPWPAKRSLGSWATSHRPGGLRGLSWRTASGTMARRLAPHAKTVCRGAPWKPWKPSHRAAPQPLADIAPSARRAENWSRALLPASTGIAPSVSMQQPHAGWHSSVRSSCRSRTCWSPGRCLRHYVREPVLTSTACTTGSCRPPLPPCRHWLWPPPSLGGQIGMGGGLPTWTRDLAYPPHVHDLVPAGALSSEGSQGFSPRSAAWLVPVRARSQLCRGTCKTARTPARVSWRTSLPRSGTRPG